MTQSAILTHVMDIRIATDPAEWDSFLGRQHFRPFLQSWTMGEIYRDIGQTPVRLIASDNGKTEAICFGHVVSARRGKHISVPYGPVIDDQLGTFEAADVTSRLVKALKNEATKHGCSFIRFSPFWLQGRHLEAVNVLGCVSSPLHLLAEHVWYVPLRDSEETKRTEESILADMRKTTRNLIRRAEKDGVTVETSKDPEKDLPEFIALHDETRKRHGFTPYTNAFFASQVKRFGKRKECTLYLAKYEGKTIAASIHMHAFGETSYHHGASSSAHQKIPASYLLQWTAIRDALKRGDRMYNFWGIAPMNEDGTPAKDHPFAGVTLFKTGFGGHILNLVHCKDAPVNKTYWLTYAFERIRKWRRGF